MGEAIDRRTFVVRTAAAGALALTAEPFAAAAAASQRLTRRRRVPLARDVRFRQGVASGEPSPHGITLWTKVDGLERRSRLKLEVARDPGFRRVVERREVVAAKEDEFAIRERVSGLDPDERYYYRFSGVQRESDVGRFKTTLPPDSRRPVRIGFFSCQDWESGFYTAHVGLAEEEDLDLVVCLGDYVYERSFYTPKARHDTTGKNRDGEVQTIEEYRDKYALYHSDARLRRVRQRHALLALYDDHEVEDNWGDGQSGGEATVGERRIPFRRRRRNGLRAFFEHMPMTRAGLRRIYGSRRLGRNVELLMLNERLFRNVVYPTGAITCPGEVQDKQSSRGGPAAARKTSDGAPPTLLGREQKRWLKRALRSSSAEWKAIANPLMIMALDLPRGEPVIDDQWDGFPEERRELCTYIRQKEIDNVAFFTGDIHTFFAGDLTPSGRQPPGGREAPVATEFVCSSISTLGIVDCFAANEIEDFFSPVGDQAARANNPHITYANVKHRGYGVMEARADRLQVDFRAPDSATVPNSPVRTLKRLHVEAGTPRVETD
jgi:alkaline phosphatase D